MNPTVLGVIGPGFLNQVPTLWDVAKPETLVMQPPYATLVDPLKEGWRVAGHGLQGSRLGFRV